MHKWFEWGGGSMVTLAAGGLLSGYPGWVKDHALYFWVAIGVGFLLFIWGKILERPETKTVPAQTTRGSKSPIVGSGNAMNAGGDIKQIIAGNYHEAAPISTAQAPPVQKPSKPVPRLTISDPEICFLFWNRMHWQKAAKDTPGAIFWIHNRAAELGEEASVAYDVTVSLTFRERGVEVEHVAHTCMLNHRENAGDIGINERGGILLGTIYGMALKVYENKTGLTRTIHLGRSPIPNSPLIEMKIVPVQELVEIKATVICEAKTVAEKTFKCLRSQDNTLTIV